MNNKTLLIIFISCLLIFFGARFLRKDRSSSFDPVLIAVDTSKVDRIRFVSPDKDNQEFELIKVDSKWQAVSGDQKVAAKNSTVSAILTPLAHLKAERIMTTDAGKYAEYEITDELATKVTVWQSGKQAGEIMVGGFKFDQATRSASGYMRKPGGNEVYLVDGFATISLKPSFDHFRDRKLVKASAEDLTSLEYMNAAGKKEVITKEDFQWHYAGMEAVDSTAFNLYLSKLVNAQGTKFSHYNSTEDLAFSEKITLYGNNMLTPIILSSFTATDTTGFYIHSTDNPEAVFVSDSSGMYKQIFLDLRQFWPDGQ